MAEIVKVKRVEKEWYVALVEDLKRLAFEGIVCTKHAIGKRILEDEQKFGKPKYGDKRIANLAKDLDVSRAELYVCVQFAKKFPELSTAVDNLSWRAIRKLLPASEPEKLETPPLPKGEFNLIYADPPWKYSDKLIEGYGAAEHHYPAMSIDELCKMPIEKLTYKNAVLFLWVTSPLLFECLPIIPAWGFEYKTSFVWDKVKHNYGHYNSVRHEFLLICTRGTYLPETKKLYDSVVTLERTTKHSEKPTHFRKMIEKMYPKARKIELFARTKTKGWTVYGDEIS